jgi:subtilisin family serine protease
MKLILLTFFLLLINCQKENIVTNQKKLLASDLQTSQVSEIETQEISTQVIPWGVQRVGYGNGVGKRVWIMDYGVDAKHPDLDVDTILSRNFFGSNEKATEDIINHGTCIAGVVAAKDNEFGVRGVAAGAKVISIKFAYLYDFGFKDAIDYMLQHIKRGEVVIIASYQAPHQVDTRIEKELLRLANKGVYIVIAAGNSASLTTTSPQRLNHRNIFTVSAFGQGDIFWRNSNYGNPPVDYSQPGVGIYTTASGGGYGTYSGTSFSAPHLAGLLLITNGKLKNGGTVIGDLDTQPDIIAIK